MLREGREGARANCVRVGVERDSASDVGDIQPPWSTSRARPVVVAQSAAKCAAHLYMLIINVVVVVAMCDVALLW